MEYIRVGGAELPARVQQAAPDRKWSGRGVKEITLTADYETMLQLFPAGQELQWEIVTERTLYISREDEAGKPVYDENNRPLIDEVTERMAHDQSQWCVAGTISDNRDGTFTVKMGMRTDAEQLAEAEAVLRILTEGEA